MAGVSPAKNPKQLQPARLPLQCFVSTPNPSLIERKERWARKMSGKAKPAARSEDRLPPGQHLTPGFPILDLGIRPEVSLSEWRLEVGGLVEHPKTFTWEEFNALPKFEDVSDFHCVTTWSKFDCRWRGVAFFTLAELVKPTPEVKHVLFASYVIPKLYAWKGAKFVRSIEFAAEDRLGFWEVRGYSNTADPWTEDRFS